MEDRLTTAHHLHSGFHTPLPPRLNLGTSPSKPCMKVKVLKPGEWMYKILEGTSPEVHELPCLRIECIRRTTTAPKAYAACRQLWEASLQAPRVQTRLTWPWTCPIGILSPACSNRALTLVGGRF